MRHESSAQSSELLCGASSRVRSLDQVHVAEGEADEVEVDVGAQALRVGVDVVGEALRERLYLEEEVALPQEPLGLPFVRQLEADPSVLGVTDLLGGVNERPFPCCRGAGISQIGSKR